MFVCLFASAESPYQVAVTIDYEEPLLLDSAVALTCSVHPDPPEGMRFFWRDFIPYAYLRRQTADERSTNATLQLNIGHPSSARYFCNVEQYGTLLASGSVNLSVHGKAKLSQSIVTQALAHAILCLHGYSIFFVLRAGTLATEIVKQKPVNN